MKRTTLKIVVVEDSRADFLLLERHLQQHGLAAQCRCVASEAELHAAIAQGDCDVVLADYHVPNLDFETMLAACRARYPDLPLILVSGSIGEERTVELLKLGLCDFVLKGSLTRLVPAIERSLRDAAERGARRAAEELLIQRNRVLRSINAYSLEVAHLPHEQMLHHVVKKTRDLFRVRAAWVSVYDEETSHLVAAYSSLSDEENSTAVRMLGAKTIGYRTHVDEKQYRMMTTELVGKLSSLHELSLGAIPAFVGSALEKLFGVGWFMAVVLMNKGRLVGTIVVAGHPRQEAPDREELLAFAGITANALARQQADAALQESEEKYRLLVDNAREAIYVVQDGVIQFANSMAIRLTGRREADVVGHAVAEFSPPEDRAEVEDHHRQLMAGEIAGSQTERRLLVAGGATVWLAVNSGRTLWHGQPATLNFASDVTARKRAEESYRMLFDEMLNGFALHEIICDGQGRPIDYRFLAVNPAFERMTGLTAAVIVGRTVLDVLPGIESRWIEAYGRVALTGEPAFFEDYSHELKKHFEVSAFRPAPNQFACIVADVTERRRAATEKALLESQLQQAQKMEAVGRLAGGVAHDFNNKLQTILGTTELLLAATEPDDPRTADLNDVMTAARGSAALTRQLLAFARKQTIAPVVLDLNDTVANLLRMLRRLIGENIHLLWCPAADLWPVKMDPTQVDQILANLTVNARDAITGVGKLSIATGRAELDAAYCQTHPDATPGAYVMLAVSDDGCGMDAATLARIFEPFFTTKPIGQGTGLGLATVYGIVKQNNGFIEVASEPGRGTTFRIYLPRHTATATAAAVAESAVLATGTETILLVEDEVPLLRLARRLLVTLGYTVLAADGPRQALRLAAEQPGEIHLLLTDVVMPDLSGRDLHDRLSTTRPGMKCLFMSGHTADAIAHRDVLDAGLHFIQKPFSRTELAAKLREVLAGSAASGQ